MAQPAFNASAFGSSPATGLGYLPFPGIGTTATSASAASGANAASGALDPAALRAQQTRLLLEQAALQAVAAVPGLQLFLPLNNVLPQVNTFVDALEQLHQMEEGAKVTAQAFIARHNAQRAQVDEYRSYDAFRHLVHDTQVAWHRGVRAALYDSVGQTVGDQVMARIPFPGWLPAVRPESGQVVAQFSGLGAAPAVPFVAIAATVLAALAALGIVFYFTTKLVTTLTSTYVARAQVVALQRLLDQREQLYRDCVAAGGTAASCATTSSTVIPDSAFVQLFGYQHGSKGALWWLGLTVVLGVAGYVAWAGYKAYRRSKGVSGLGATRLRSLADPTVKSRYQLEVE